MQADEYRKLAETEDRMWYFRALHRRFSQALAERLPLGRASVLDAGCGTGGLIRALREVNPAWEVSGLDFSATACGLARRRTGGEITEGSITALPFGDGTFEAIVSGDVLCQVDDPALALREFSRVLKRGGVVLVNVPAYPWLWSYHDDAVGSKHRFTRPELVRQFREAGLEVTFASYANLLPLPLVVARRKLFPPAQPTSDVRLYPAPVEAVFAGMARAEHAWMRRGWPLPAGSSVFVAGVKGAEKAKGG
jgi:SAM-dependent methyltransferase